MAGLSATTWKLFSFTETLGPDISGGVTMQFVAATGEAPGSASTLEIDDLTMTVVFPVPAAVWLFGSGLLGLIGVARRKKV